jgi:EAL domain-containing protein (putative c-di-GMP-specific phosphodiesterase class I)
MLFIKYLLFAIVSYIMLIISTYYIYFDKYIDRVIKEQTQLNTMIYDKFQNDSQEYILYNQFIKIKNNFENIHNSNRFKYLNINYINHYITSKSLIIHSNKNIDLSWQLHDVIIDTKFGKLNKINNLLYSIESSIHYDYENLLTVKSQASSYDTIENIISLIDFNLPQYKNDYNDNTKQNNQYLFKLIKERTNLNNEEQSSILYINDSLEMAKITYKLNNNLTNEIIYNNLIQSYTIISYYYITIFVLLIIFNYIMMQLNINQNIKKLKKYSEDIISNNFYKFDSSIFSYKNVRNLADDMSKLSKQIVSVMNEINVNKNMMELQISTDTLTKLPTTKVFEQDMKSLFLFQVESYIAKIKLVCLSEFALNSSQEEIDKLIKNFVTDIQLTIKDNSLEEYIKLYRTYGSEFIIIAKNFDYDAMQEFLNKLVLNLIHLKKLYSVKAKIAHIVSIPFNKYSNTQELLTTINTHFNNTIDNQKLISFYNQDNEKQVIEHYELEKVVTSIIKNNAFTLSYKYDTYIYEKTNIYMQEVAPNLLNFDGSTIPIGIFISVAHEKNIAIDFDKKLILKVFKYIQQNNINHKLAINISIDAMKNDEFIIWLESQLLFDFKDTLDNVVFSITSFAAKNNFEEFIHFSHNIKRFNSQIILKRFNYNDFSSEKLNKINVDYIRVHSDYTNNIDINKKGVLSNIYTFCSNNDIILLADSVKNKSDNTLLKSLGFFGTSK